MTVDNFAVSIPQTASSVEVRLSPHARDLVDQADRAKVWDEVSLASATDLAKFIRVALKNAEEERTKITKPINFGLRLLNERFAKFTEPLDRAKKALDRKIADFQLAERARLEKEAAAARAAIEIVDPETRPNSPEDLGFVPPAAVPAPSMRTRGDLATSSVVDNWKHYLVDITKVPREYTKIVLDDVAIAAAIKAGAREIPGLEIKNEAVVRIR